MTMNTSKAWVAVKAASVSTVLSFGTLLFTGIASADTTNNNTIPNTINSEDSLKTLLCNIIGWMVWILLAVAIIMIVLAAYQYVLAGDDTEKTSKARKTLTYSAVGIVVVLLAYGFPSIVASIAPGSVDMTQYFTCSNAGQ